MPDWSRRLASQHTSLDDKRKRLEHTVVNASDIGIANVDVNAIAFAFSFPIRVYWEDTDAGGIVFFANYLKFFERARTEWLRSLGLEQQQLKQTTGGMFVVAESNVRYLRPARLDDELIVTATLKEIGKASMIIEQQALLKAEQSSPERVLLCEGSVRIGWVNVRTLQPQRMPACIIDSMTPRHVIA